MSSLASTRIALSEKGIDLRSLPARSRTEMKQVDALVFAYTLAPSYPRRAHRLSDRGELS